MKLTLYSHYGYYSSQIKYFMDRKDKPLENILNEVVIELTKYIYKKKEQRIKWEEEERRYKEEKLRQEREREKIKNLLQETNDWVHAKNIRKYISAVNNANQSNNRLHGDEDIKSWIKWALMYADTIDLIIKFKNAENK